MAPQMPVNTFEALLVERLTAIIQTHLAAIGSSAIAYPGESKEIDTNPRVVVSATSSEESVYQTGIYEVVVEMSCKVNLDAEGSNDLHNPDSSQALFATILDVSQYPDLIQQLGATNEIIVRGIVPGGQRLNEIVDRQWNKVLSISFFGFVIPSTPQ